MNGKVKRTFGLGLFTVALVAAPLLAAATGADAVKTRIAGFKQLGAASKKLKDELDQSSPNVATLQLAARDIGNLARSQPSWFPKGSGPQPGVKTRAKPEIWTKPGEFKAALNGFSLQSAALLRVAASGDVAAIRAEHRKLAAACSTCHKSFRDE